MSESQHLQELTQFLCGLPSETLNELYGYEASCVAVFRCLSPLSKLVCQRLLFVDGAVPSDIVENWLVDSERKKLASVRSELSKLNIVDADCDDYVLNGSFVDGLQSAVIGLPSTSTQVFLEGDIDPKHSKTVEELTNYGNQRWECVLYYLALSNVAEAGQISKECQNVLVKSGFASLNQAQDVEITSKGFGFLLKEPQSQVWGYLLCYLEYLKDKDKDLAECIAFIFQLSQCQLGCAYGSEKFTPRMQDFLQHLREIGLVFQAKRKLMRFFPTHLATSLLFEDGRAVSKSGQAENRGFLVVETNFRLYAYTDSNLMLAIVSTFTDMAYRFSGMSVGVLTRESVRRALQAGITADQIIEFIRTNAHEAMQDNSPLIPPNITDQLRLWEQERERFQFDDGVLYSQFLTDADFERLRDYAKSIGALLWDNLSSRTMIVDVEYHDDVKRFWKMCKGKE